MSNRTPTNTLVANALLTAALKALRAEGGLSMRGMAAAARGQGYGLSASRISELELGKRCWSALQVDAVAAGLGITVEIFLARASQCPDASQCPHGHGHKDVALMIPDRPDERKKPPAIAAG